MTTNDKGGNRSPYEDVMYEYGCELLMDFHAKRIATAAADSLCQQIGLAEALANDELTMEELSVDVMERLVAVSRREGFDLREILDEATQSLDGFATPPPARAGTAIGPHRPLREGWKGQS
jgi:hypothetical protein